MTDRINSAESKLFDQFKNAPNIKAFLAALMKKLDETDDILSSLAFNRWIETAEKVWLDSCGHIVGIWPRPASLVDDNLIFTCKDIDDPDDINKAFADIDQTTGGRLTTPNGLASDNLVDDITYRRYIKAKAYVSTSRTTERDIVNFCRDIFDIDVEVVTESKGHVRITPATPITTQIRLIIQRLAPVSAGVKITVDFA